VKVFTIRKVSPNGESGEIMKSEQPMFYEDDESVFCLGSHADHVVDGDQIWEGFTKWHPFLTWAVAKSIAKRYLTPLQYVIFSMRGQVRGFKTAHLGARFDVSHQAIADNLKISAKKLNKILKKYLQTHIYMRGVGHGFQSHVYFENLLKAGEYVGMGKNKEIFRPVCKKCKSKLVKKGYLVNSKLYCDKCKDLIATKVDEQKVIYF